MPAPQNVNPVDIDVEAVLNRTMQKWPGWWNNFAQNLPRIRTGRDIASIPKRNTPAIIVGAGPSLRPSHLSLLKSIQDRATIIAADRMLKPLLQVGIDPSFVATVDGDPSVAEFYNIRATKTDAVLNAVTTHPNTAMMAHAQTRQQFWYVSFFDDPQLPTCPHCKRVSPTAGFHYMTGGKMILQALGNVGAFCWHLGYFLGCNPLIMIGMDYSYKPDTAIETTHYYDAYLKIAAKEHLFETLSSVNPLQNDIEDHVRKCLKCRQRVKASYEIHTNPDFQSDYMIDKIWTVYKNLFMPFIKMARVKTVNCSEGALHGPGITGMTLENAVGKYFARN